MFDIFTSNTNVDLKLNAIIVVDIVNLVFYVLSFSSLEKHKVITYFKTRNACLLTLLTFFCANFTANALRRGKFFFMFSFASLDLR